jgi:hypothetical protein
MPNKNGDIGREGVSEKMMEELINEMTCSNEKETIENETDTVSDIVVKEQFDLSSIFPLDQSNSILEQNKIDFITGAVTT